MGVRGFIAICVPTQRAFAAIRPNEKWASDITYVPTRRGWLYVAVLMDLYSRRIIGWAVVVVSCSSTTLNALEMALQQRRVPVGRTRQEARTRYAGSPKSNSFFSVAKKLSTTALSQQFPGRLMEHRMPRVASRC